jgi:hypothetical protein
MRGKLSQRSCWRSMNSIVCRLGFYTDFCHKHRAAKLFTVKHLLLPPRLPFHYCPQPTSLPIVPDRAISFRGSNLNLCFALTSRFLIRSRQRSQKVLLVPAGKLR